MHSALLSLSAVLRNLTPIRALPSPVGLVQSPCTTKYPLAPVCRGQLAAVLDVDDAANVRFSGHVLDLHELARHDGRAL